MSTVIAEVPLTSETTTAPLIEIDGLVVWTVKARAALHDHEHMVFMRMRMQAVLAARGINLQRRPHIVGFRQRRVAAALIEQLRMQTEDRRFHACGGYCRIFRCDIQGGSVHSSALQSGECFRVTCAAALGLA